MCLKRNSIRCTTLMSLIVLILISCTSREEATNFYSDPIKFDEAAIAPLPTTVTYAEKRGFGDFNGDGIEDMLEIEDESFWGQDYKVKIFYGYYKDGILHFISDFVKLDLNIKMKWFSDATKLDVGDINGDGYADVIFTEYQERWGTDRLDIAFGINQNGKSFRPQSEDINFKKDVSLSSLVVLFVDAYSSVETLDDYLKMDWADIDGNGSDDLILGWDGSHDLYLEVIYTENTGSGDASFVDMVEYEIPEFMRNRSISELDFEDFNGDDKSDVFVHYSGMSNNNLSVAINTGEGFNPHKDYIVKDVDMKFFAFEKYDTFDVNSDGMADFVHVGEKDGHKIMAYNLVRKFEGTIAN